MSYKQIYLIGKRTINYHTLSNIKNIGLLFDFSIKICMKSKF